MKKIIMWVVLGILVCMVILVGVVGYNLYNGDHIAGFKVNIQNKMDVEISGLKIACGENIVDVPTIKGKEKIKLKVSTEDVVGESGMVIYYLDKNNKKQREILVGYLEGGYSGTVDVELLSIDGNGKIKFKIEEKSFY